MDSIVSLSLIMVTWIVLTLILLGLTVVNLFSLQSVINNLRATNPTKWSDSWAPGKYKTMGEIAKENTLWMILVLIVVGEVIAISYAPVREWVLNNLLLGALVFVLPVFAVVVTIIVVRLRKKDGYTKNQEEDKNK
jgi:hypothetical protein